MAEDTNDNVLLSAVGADTFTAATKYIGGSGHHPLPILAQIDGTDAITPLLASLSTVATACGSLATLFSAALNVNGDLQAVLTDSSGNPVDPTAAGAVIGGTQADSPLAFAPVTEGGLAKTANPAAVDDGDVVNALHDKLGKRISIPALREVKAIQTTTITGTSETTIVTAGGSGVFKDLYRLVMTNSSATAVTVAIKDATAGTTRYTFAVPAGATVGFSADAGSAAVQSAAANNWTAQVSSAVSSIIITAETVANL